MPIGISYKNLNYAGLGLGFEVSEPQKRKIKQFLVVYCIFTVIIAALPCFSNAANGDALTDLFQTSAFSGSWEVFSKFNFLGKILNFLISSICLIGLMLTALKLVITILVKSHETFFLKIHQLKSSGKGQGLFGIKQLGKEVCTGNYGTGLDAFIGALLALLPDLLEYSDYNPEKMAYNLQEDDTLTTYILKTSLPTIMTIFFFAIGFNGTLLRAYGNIANAMSTAANSVVEINLSNYVSKVMNAGSYYNFNFNSEDEFQDLQLRISKKIYNSVLLKMKDLNSDNMRLVGSNIESWVIQNIGQQVSAIDSKLNNLKTAHKIADDSAAASNITFSVTLNNNSEHLDSKGTYAISDNASNAFGVTLTAGSQPLYVHVYLSKRANADEKDYFDSSVNDTTATEAPSNGLTNE